jgi:hypothetical protein
MPDSYLPKTDKPKSLSHSFKRQFNIAFLLQAVNPKG